MKAKFLKIAGVKSEKEFYRKFPTEEAFMKAHGKAFKKAQWGVAQMTAKGLQDLGNKFNNPVTNDPIQNIRPTTMGPVVNAAPNPGVPFQPMSQAGMANWNYNQPPQAINPSSPAATMKAQREEFEGYSNILDDYNKSKAPKDEAKDKEGGDKKKKNNFGLAGDIVQGIQALQEEKRARRRAEQAAGVSDVARKASESRDVDANSRRRYNRPEDQRITGEEMFPIYGVGTNVLTAKDGVEASSKGGIPILSLVDYMKASGRNSSMKSRKELARSVGLKNYTGKEDENRSLLKSLMNEDEMARSTYETDRIVNPETGNVDFEETQVYQEPIEVQQSRVAAIRKAYEELQDDVLSKAVKKSIDKTKGVQPAVNTVTYKGPAKNEDFFTYANRIYRSANPSAPIIDSRPDDRKLNAFEVMQNKLDAGAYDPSAASMFLRDNPNNPLNALLAFGVNAAAEWPLRLGISSGKLLTGKGEARDVVTAALGAVPAVNKIADKLPAFGRLVRMKSLNPMSRNVGNPMFEEPTLQNLFSGANRHMPSVKKVAAQYKYDMNRMAQALKTDKKLAKVLQDAAEEEEILMGVGTKMKPGTIPFDKFSKRAQQNLNDLYERNYRSGGEIANTFAPNTLYTDLREGGEIPKAKGGFAQAFGFDKNPSMTDIANAGGGDFMSDVITKFGGENAGGNLGGSIGKAAGQAIGGPVGGMIGQVGGQLIGSLIDQNPNRIKKAQNATMTNMGAMAFNNAGRSAQAQYSSFMEDGGRVSPYEWVSHTWQPQEIVKFGEHNVSDLLKPDPTMDTLRAGGHLKQYTAPTEEAMFTGRPSMEEGGELQTHWGGYAEPMSYNPYLPEGGETVMFRGQSHDESDGKGRTGIGITYGDSPVEVERGEPAMKMKDGGEQSSLVVFGNLKIPHNMLGDPKAKGKNFKSYVADITKQEQKLNKSIDKNTNLLDSLEVDTPFDKLRFNSYTANLYGGNQKLKEAAAKKMDAAALQTAMNDTIEEYGMKTSDRGTISAKNGIEIAQDGKKTPKMLEAIDLYTQKRRKDNFYGSAKEEDVATLIKKNPWYDWSKFNPNSEKSVKNFQIAYNKKAKEIGSPSRLEVDGLFGDQTASAKSLYGWDTLKGELIPTPRNMPTPKTPDILTKGPQIMTPPPAEKPNEENNVDRLKMIFNEALPFLRPTDAEPLDPRQLYGEMYALSTNQLEPVQAQTFQPELSVPYDISLQDILNENEATFRSQQRMAGYNPAAQAILNAQKYQANQKVLAEQLRRNINMKDQVYRENRNIINESRLKNLDIFDRQYTRQEEAKSKTKAINQEALNSIAAKYQQNQLENRTLQVYENQYNYRFDPRFRAINMNPLADLTPVMDEEGNVLQYVKKTETQKKDKFGRPAGSSTTVTSKAARNGSIVRSLKSI